MKKKAISFLLLAVLLFTINGCAKNFHDAKESGSGNTQPNAAVTTMRVIPILPETPYVTNAYVYESSKPGPAVMIVGGVHGNEPAGSLAAQKFCEIPVLKGTLIVVPRANATALAANVRTLPEVGDINRAYPGKQDGTQAEKISFAIVQLMKQYKVNMVVDLHEGYAFNALDSKSVGETILPGKDDTSVLLAMDAVEAINQKIKEPYKRFSVLANPIVGSTAHYANSYLKVPAFTVETSDKQALDDRVEYSFQIAKFLISSQGVIEK